MSMTTEAMGHPMRESTFRWAAGGSMMEALGALAAIALAIVGLAGAFPSIVAGVATIVLGAALMAQCGAFGAGWAFSGVSETESYESGTMHAGFLGGLAGVVLGILALLGVASPTLLSVAVLVFGASLLFSNFSPTVPLQASYGIAGGGGQVMIGIGAVTLGILAVLGIAEMTLILVGLLGLGVVALFMGSAIGARHYATSSRPS